MKLALIAQPRCGTNSIMFYVSDLLKSFMIYGEPFNPGTYAPPIEYDEILSHENVFIKTMFNQKPDEVLELTNVDFILKLISDFDNVVFLIRRDVEKQTESYTSAIYENRWISKYVYNKGSQTLHATLKNDLTIDQTNLINLAKRLNKKVYYYEDVYFDVDKMKELLSELGVKFDRELYYKWLDSSKKYRLEIDNQSKKLI